MIARSCGILETGSGSYLKLQLQSSTGGRLLLALLCFALLCYKLTCRLCGAVGLTDNQMNDSVYKVCTLCNNLSFRLSFCLSLKLTRDGVDDVMYSIVQGRVYTIYCDFRT